VDHTYEIFRGVRNCDVAKAYYDIIFEDGYVLKTLPRSGKVTFNLFKELAFTAPVMTAYLGKLTLEKNTRDLLRHG
jgi:hypothetical protein